MKKFFLFNLLLCSYYYSFSQAKLGDGLYRIQFLNYANCIAEIQSYSQEMKEIELMQTLPILRGLKSKNTGLEVLFPIYQVVDYKGAYPDMKAMSVNGQKQLVLFENSIERLKELETCSLGNDFKAMLLKSYINRLNFEKVFLEWLQTSDDEAFQKNMLAFRNDYLVRTTMERLISYKDWKLKVSYMHAQLIDALRVSTFLDEDLVRAQIEFLNKGAIQFLVSKQCK